jgi:hypothetical protein
MIRMIINRIRKLKNKKKLESNNNKMMDLNDELSNLTFPKQLQSLIDIQLSIEKTPLQPPSFSSFSFSSITGLVSDIFAEYLWWGKSGEKDKKYDGSVVKRSESKNKVGENINFSEEKENNKRVSESKNIHSDSISGNDGEKLDEKNGDNNIIKNYNYVLGVEDGNNEDDDSDEEEEDDEDVDVYDESYFSHKSFQSDNLENSNLEISSDSKISLIHHSPLAHSPPTHSPLEIEKKGKRRQSKKEEHFIKFLQDYLLPIDRVPFTPSSIKLNATNTVAGSSSPNDSSLLKFLFGDYRHSEEFITQSTFIANLDVIFQNKLFDKFEILYSFDFTSKLNNDNLRWMFYSLLLTSFLDVYIICSKFIKDSLEKKSYSSKISKFYFDLLPIPELSTGKILDLIQFNIGSHKSNDEKNKNCFSSSSSSDFVKRSFTEFWQPLISPILFHFFFLICKSRFIPHILSLVNSLLIVVYVFFTRYEEEWRLNSELEQNDVSLNDSSNSIFFNKNSLLSILISLLSFITLRIRKINLHSNLCFSFIPIKKINSLFKPEDEEKDIFSLFSPSHISKSININLTTDCFKNHLQWLISLFVPSGGFSDTLSSGFIECLPTCDYLPSNLVFKMSNMILKFLNTIISDYYYFLEDSWKIIFYCFSQLVKCYDYNSGLNGSPFCDIEGIFDCLILNFKKFSIFWIPYAFNEGISALNSLLLNTDFSEEDLERESLNKINQNSEISRVLGKGINHHNIDNSSIWTNHLPISKKLECLRVFLYLSDIVVGKINFEFLLSEFYRILNPTLLSSYVKNSIFVVSDKFKIFEVFDFDIQRNYFLLILTSFSSSSLESSSSTVRCEGYRILSGIISSVGSKLTPEFWLLIHQCIFSPLIATISTHMASFSDILLSSFNNSNNKEVDLQNVEMELNWVKKTIEIAFRFLSDVISNNFNVFLKDEGRSNDSLIQNLNLNSFFFEYLSLVKLLLSTQSEELSELISPILKDFLWKLGGYVNLIDEKCWMYMKDVFYVIVRNITPLELFIHYEEWSNNSLKSEDEILSDSEKPCDSCKFDYVNIRWKCKSVVNVIKCIAAFLSSSLQHCNDNNSFSTNLPPSKYFFSISYLLYSSFIFSFLFNVNYGYRIFLRSLYPSFGMSVPSLFALERESCILFLDISEKYLAKYKKQGLNFHDPKIENFDNIGNNEELENKEITESNENNFIKNLEICFISTSILCLGNCFLLNFVFSHIPSNTPVNMEDKNEFLSSPTKVHSNIQSNFISPTVLIQNYANQLCEKQEIYAAYYKRKHDFLVENASNISVVSEESTSQNSILSFIGKFNQNIPQNEDVVNTGSNNSSSVDTLLETSGSFPKQVFELAFSEINKLSNILSLQYTSLSSSKTSFPFLPLSSVFTEFLKSVNQPLQSPSLGSVVLLISLIFGSLMRISSDSHDSVEFLSFPINSKFFDFEKKSSILSLTYKSLHSICSSSSIPSSLYSSFVILNSLFICGIETIVRSSDLVNVSNLASMCLIILNSMDEELVFIFFSFFLFCYFILFLYFILKLNPYLPLIYSIIIPLIESDFKKLRSQISIFLNKYFINFNKTV